MAGPAFTNRTASPELQGTTFRFLGDFARLRRSNEKEACFPVGAIESRTVLRGKGSILAPNQYFLSYVGRYQTHLRNRPLLYTRYHRLHRRERRRQRR